MWSVWTGYNAPVMAFDSRRICLMEFFAGIFGLFNIYYLFLAKYYKKNKDF
jgi:hypothetical protein